VAISFLFDVNDNKTLSWLDLGTEGKSEFVGVFTFLLSDSGRHIERSIASVRKTLFSESGFEVQTVHSGGGEAADPFSGPDS
jgi:hypothetical protein